jgi:D-alanine-D-alanine ligase
MLVLVVYNKPVLSETHLEAASEHEIVQTAEHVGSRLEQAGYEVRLLPVGRDIDAIRRLLHKFEPDCVFNLFEGFADDPASEWQFARILEHSGVPFTGSPSEALRLANGKHLAKQLLRAAGLPTPDAWVVHRLPLSLANLPWPVIVKPACRDGSEGIDQGSVVTDRVALEERIARLLSNYGAPVLVEQYLPGRDISMALVETPELLALPASEILFNEKDAGYWPIVTYDAKWQPGSREYEATPPVYPAEIAPELADRLMELTRRVFRLFGCRDYARVDFRVDQDRPNILEINPNPCFSAGAALAATLRTASMDHSEFTVRLVRRAMERAHWECQWHPYALTARI